MQRLHFRRLQSHIGVIVDGLGRRLNLWLVLQEVVVEVVIHLLLEMGVWSLSEFVIFLKPRLCVVRNPMAPLSIVILLTRWINPCFGVIWHLNQRENSFWVCSIVHLARWCIFGYDATIVRRRILQWTCVLMELRFYWLHWRLLEHTGSFAATLGILMVRITLGCGKLSLTWEATMYG